MKEHYKGWDIIPDTSSIGGYIIRKNFSNFPDIHNSTLEEAKETVDEICVLTDFQDWLVYGDKKVYITSEMIYEFVTGK